MKNLLKNRNLFDINLLIKWVICLERENCKLSSDIYYDNLQNIAKEWTKIVQIALCL